jgi:hypothetical protein
MSFLMPKVPAMPPVPPVEPLPTAPDYESADRRKKAAEDAARIRRGRIGRKQTILTSAQGDESEAEVKKKTLLGE